MRWLAVCLLVIGLTQFAKANRRISVAELEHTLAVQRAAHLGDAENAKLLEGIELTERLTEHSLQQILTSTSPGAQASRVLEFLADTSAFLDPPANELPQQPAPDLKSQQAMIGRAVDFVAVTLQHLPDFVVTRSTRSFDNISTSVSQSQRLILTSMHQVDAFDRQITYLNGREVVETRDSGKRGKRTTGLQTWGEFGPVLATVLRDAINGHFAWSHWELDAEGDRVVVFRYSVPTHASHYQLNYCCTLSAPFWSPTDDYRDAPGYHGSLSLDLLTGAILRVTVEADVKSTDVIERADIAVEYGKVDIGGRTYICPLRSLAFSVDHYHPGMTLLEPVTRINKICFVNYHKFGSTTRIVSDSQKVETSSEDQKSVASVGAAAISTGTADLGESAIPSSEPRPAPIVAPSPTPTLKPHSPVQVDAQEQALLRQSPIFTTQTRDVLVDVVVTQKSGEPVLDLRREDFSVSEDGQPQSIDFFEVHGQAPAATHPAEAASATLTPGAIPSPDRRVEDSVNVILLDMLNTSPRSQIFVRQNLNAFFRKMAPGSRVALFALGSKLRCAQGLTSDAGLLARAFNDPANNVFPQKVGGSWDRDDEAAKEAEIVRLEKAGAGADAIKAIRSALEQLAATKRQNQMATTLGALDDLAQYLAGVPGRKNLLWFAETFPVRLSPVVSGEKGSPADDSFAHEHIDRIREVSHRLTTARVAVYPIQAEGVMEEHILEANLAAPGSEQENSSMQRKPGNSARSETPEATALYKKSAAERADAIMTMEQLARETGGKAFFNTNDLGAATARAIANGANYYTIGYTPSNTKMDGQYRNIELRVQGKYQVSYREGYFADSERAATSDSNTQASGARK